MLTGVLGAAFWGLISGLPLVIGAVLATYSSLSNKTIAILMAFGSGVLIAIISFSLMREAYLVGGIIPASIGFLAGALIFNIGSHQITQRGARYRKMSHGPEAGAGEATGLTLALGSLMDNIPESVALGISLLVGSVSLPVLIGIMLSNFAEATGSAQGMKSTRSHRYVLSTWGIIALVNIPVTALAFLFLGQLSSGSTAFALSLAAGAIIAMLAETMMPEAYRLGGHHISFATAAGFLIAFIVAV